MVASADYDPIVVEPQLNAQKLDELLGAARESAKLDYKRRHDPRVKQDSVELTKDLIAMANTAGGYVVIGVEDGGLPRGLTKPELATLDESTMRGQVETYIGTSLEVFVDSTVRWNGHSFCIVTVLRSPRSPLVFEKDGQYPISQGSSRNVTVFRAGDVFVRHGSKSERWNQDDVRTIYGRVVGREKERWLAEVLPDVRRLLGAAVSGQALPPLDARELVSQDAETFERTLRTLVRRLR